MINLIERFIEETGQMRVLLSHDKRSSDYQEVYFFLGKDSLLCITKQENKVLYQVKYSQLQINIISATEFAFNVGGQSLFFCQDDGIITPLYQEPLYQEKLIDTEEGDINNKEKKHTNSTITATGIATSVTSDEKYKYKAFCEKCNRKKCSQYDTINGRNFKFGKGAISEDMLNQYDKYCENKIKKFGCTIE